ncbi:hypothetical protein [Thauera butanivorans]|uniref:hypothetical protein n=1 Tax=Thauera butanivorans TaxID=86174 RepID=UPI000A53E3BC|nr:hypothetical protein [Thauera butanivorans]
MPNDAAAAERAAFLKREARQSWADRLATVAAEVRMGRSGRGGGLRKLTGFRVVRARGADGLDYLVVRGIA